MNKTANSSMYMPTKIQWLRIRKLKVKIASSASVP